MSRTQTIYNQIGVFSTNAPSNYPHFLDSNGNFTNNLDGSATFNTIFPLIRIISCEYGFSPQRTDVKSLGYFGTISRVPINNPDVNLSFSFYEQGIINLMRLGFKCNYPLSGVINNPSLNSTGRYCPIVTFLDRSYSPDNETAINYPLKTREPRNIFIATNSNYDDFNDTGIINNNLYKTNGNIGTFAFGDCYLNSFKTACSLGSPVQSSVSYICSNIMFYNGVSGFNIPALNPKSNTLYTGITFNLPNTFEGNKTDIPTVLLPNGITININHTDNSPILDLPIDFNDIKIQNYDISLDLNREPLNSLTYKLPLDRRINPPVYANLSFNVIVGDNATGSVLNNIIQDNEYNISLKLKYQINQNSGQTAIQYDFLRAKFNGINLSESISQRRNGAFSFTAELNPNDLTKGFFISGQLGIPTGGYNSTGVLLDSIDDGGGIFPLLMMDGSTFGITTTDQRILF